MTVPAKSFVLGTWQHEHGYSQVIYIRSLDRRLGFVPWSYLDPYIPFSGVVTTNSFVARYGHRPEGIKGDGKDPSQVGIDPGLFEAGSTAGERGLTAGDRLRAAAMLPANPFGITDPENWRPSVQDTMDCIYVRDKSEPTKSFFDGWLTRTLDAAFPAPPAPPQPPIVKPPVVTPPPPPIAPPAGSWGAPLAPAARRVEELRSLALAVTQQPVFGAFFSGLAWALLADSWPSTKPIAVSLLKLVRLVRRGQGDPRPIPAEDL